jgi:hypothetical protein
MSRIPLLLAALLLLPPAQAGTLLPTAVAPSSPRD